MANLSKHTPRLTFRWFVVLVWKVHRTLFRVSLGRLGLWPPREGKWGAMRLTAIGRRSGQERSVILAYIEDGPNLVTLAMNGWDAAEPVWWLNLQAHPRARVQLAGGGRNVIARAASGQERERLWERFRALDENLDAYARRRPAGTEVVVLEPRTTTD
ncbi:MAG: nitroreductase/quinone reductase family protein [Thermomicrobiales bacterium]